MKLKKKKMAGANNSAEAGPEPDPRAPAKYFHEEGARDGGWGGSSGIYLRDWADDRERLYRSYSTLSVRPQRTRTCHPESLIITTEELVQPLLYLRGGIALPSRGAQAKVHDPAPVPATHGPSHPDLHSCRPP